VNAPSELETVNVRSMAEGTTCSYAKLLSIPKAQSILQILHKDAREHESFDRALLNTMMDDISSYVHWIPFIYKWELRGRMVSSKSSLYDYDIAHLEDADVEVSLPGLPIRCRWVFLYR
jgi:cobalamin-dependent methionine synthase I